MIVRLPPQREARFRTGRIGGKPSTAGFAVRTFVAMAIALGSISGCAPLMNVNLPWDNNDDATENVPDRILAVWSDTVLHQPGKSATRGFGGRVFFYKEGSSDPIEVSGAVAVYAFDAERQNASNAAPEKKFVFTTEQVDKHFSKCSLGPSYSFWLPWDAVGGPPRQISLITRFEGSQGGIVISQPATKLLPGVGSKAEAKVTQSTDSVVRQASFVVDSDTYATNVDSDANKPESDLTIALPPSLSKRLAQRQTKETDDTDHSASRPAPQSIESESATANHERSMALHERASGSVLATPTVPTSEPALPAPSGHHLERLRPKPRNLPER